MANKHDFNDNKFNISITSLRDNTNGQVMRA